MTRLDAYALVVRTAATAQHEEIADKGKGKATNTEDESMEEDDEEDDDEDEEEGEDSSDEEVSAKSRGPSRVGFSSLLAR